jgi:hypothetical protein
LTITKIGSTVAEFNKQVAWGSMASHPYISGPGNVTQIIGLLRKNFPSTMNADTVKKYGLAPNNESYVINALQFIGVIDEDGKRTDKGHKVFSIHNDEEFKAAFDGLIRDAYSELFSLHGDGVWTLNRGQLINYFRTTDKTSDVIGGRQAGVFKAFADLAGHKDTNAATAGKVTGKPKQKAALTSIKAKNKAPVVKIKDVGSKRANESARDMALTVRIEINLPANGSRENYDDIFQSIKENLLND